MSRLRARFRPEDVAGLLGSLRVIESTIQHLSTDDVEDIANWGVAFIRDIFPKSKNSRRTSVSAGGDLRDRGTPLWKGWRKYMSASSQGSGFIIKHARQNQGRVSTILASLDQGSRAYDIQLKRGQAFAFVNGAGEKVVRAGGKAGGGKISIPSRRPLPTREGYISPTAQFIREQIVWMTEQRKKNIEEAWTKKLSRLAMLRERNSALIAKRIVEEQ